MQKVIATLKTLTYAQKAKRILLKSGISSNIVKLNASDSKGCAYGVEFDIKSHLEVIKLLRENNLEYGMVKYEGYK